MVWFGLDCVERVERKAREKYLRRVLMRNMRGVSKSRAAFIRASGIPGMDQKGIGCWIPIPSIHRHRHSKETMERNIN